MIVKTIKGAITGEIKLGNIKEKKKEGEKEKEKKQEKANNTK